jgi:hypothetical protein
MKSSTHFVDEVRHRGRFASPLAELSRETLVAISARHDLALQPDLEDARAIVYVLASSSADRTSRRAAPSEEDACQESSSSFLAEPF